MSRVRVISEAKFDVLLIRSLAGTTLLLAKLVPVGRLGLIFTEHVPVG
jgi:hypothetical protein